MAIKNETQGANSNGEFARIGRIAKILGHPSHRVITGIGDDAAVTESPRNKLLLCTDAMVEGVHFDLSFCTPAELGHKALAATLSDIAAMNGEPLYALFSIALSARLPETFLDHFYEGVRGLAETLKVDIVGGDLTASRTDLFIDVTAIGTSAAPALRSGAKVGDFVVVSGFPGTSAAGLHSIKTVGREKTARELITAHLLPQPRFNLLKALTAHSCTSLIDVSDGLSNELHHLAASSKIGFEIQASKFPIHPEVLKIATTAQAIQWALAGGEDYELLATVDAAAIQAAGGPPEGFTVIGRVVESEKGLTFTDLEGKTQPLVATGFDHFA